MTKPTLSSPHIEALEAYQSARRIGGSGDVWLNANESPFPRRPMPMDVSEYHRYPDERPALVEAAYAAYAGVPAANAIALRGADEAIDLLVRAYCRAGSDSILLSRPTYGMYEVCAQIQDAGIIDVPLTAGDQLDLAAIRAAGDPRVVFVCHPNNPTGNPLRREDILAVVEHFTDRALVVVDEAYIEFCPEQTLVPALAQHDNLVVVRTLSKAFGLAGVHVGFLLANPGVMATIRKVVAPYPLADPCAQIALQALSAEGVARMRDEVAELARRRDAFAGALGALAGVTGVRSSATNFVTATFADVDDAWEQLTGSGIVARRVAHPTLRDAIRFTIGTDEEMTRVLSALDT